VNFRRPVSVQDDRGEQVASGELSRLRTRRGGTDVVAEELAVRLGVSIRTVDNLLVRGLPHIKLSQRLIRFPRAAVDEWLAERQVRRA
jgi:excisionase family DNA binding protein